jgi:hypothetical protein
MSDKSPKKSSSKTAASKTLKEKRLDKRTKVQGKASSEISDAVGKKR